jgi:hypothetical protein
MGGFLFFSEFGKKDFFKLNAIIYAPIDLSFFLILE